MQRVIRAFAAGSALTVVTLFGAGSSASALPEATTSAAVSNSVCVPGSAQDPQSATLASSSSTGASSAAGTSLAFTGSNVAALSGVGGGLIGLGLLVVRGTRRREPAQAEQ